MNYIKDISLLDPNGTYSYTDYLLWQFEEKIELLKGKIFKMSPAPNLKHQRISWQMGLILGVFFKKKPCSVFSAPFDVRLYDSKKSEKASKEIHTVVQPDLCIICDKAKLDEQGCVGAPDLIVEILSKGNTEKEMKIKYELYEESGVLEYWVIYPYEENLLRFVLNEKQKYELKQIYTTNDVVTTPLFPELCVNLEEVFTEE
ncbi:MAG: Uma2 family endonuclease [Cytophagales bacterium]|nr:MAG: Uma2 family endonuclease [Cytophagales bacterium]